MTELITKSEFAKRLGISPAAISKAISSGRITTVQVGKKVLVDWLTQAEMFEANRSKKQNDGHGGGKKNPNKTEKHIGNPETQDEIGFDTGFSDYSKISDEDMDGMPPKGSVAYYQAKKLYWDSKRNRVKYYQEVGTLMTTEDAIALYAEKLTEVADAVQNIPSRCSGLISAQIRRSVREWNGNMGDSLESEVHKLLTEQTRMILQDLATKKRNSKLITEEYLNGGKKKK